MQNLIKEKIARGEPALGVSVMFSSPQIVEMIGHAGFDWVLLDCEHGSIGPADIELLALAADAVTRTAKLCLVQGIVMRRLLKLLEAR